MITTVGWNGAQGSIPCRTIDEAKLCSEDFVNRVSDLESRLKN